MARPSNTVEMTSLTITVTPQLKYYLERLGAEGLYPGTSAADVAKALLAEHIRDMLHAGKLVKEDLVVEDGKARPVSKASTS